MPPELKGQEDGVVENNAAKSNPTSIDSIIQNRTVLKPSRLNIEERGNQVIKGITEQKRRSLNFTG